MTTSLINDFIFSDNLISVWQIDSFDAYNRYSLKLLRVDDPMCDVDKKVCWNKEKSVKSKKEASWKQQLASI